MAVDLQTVAMYQREIADEGGKFDLWDQLPSNVRIKSEKERVRNLITQLKQHEQQLLNTLAEGLTIEELRKNIQKYHDNGFFRFSHGDVATIVESYRRQKAKANLMTAKAFTTWFNNTIPKAAVQEWATSHNLSLGEAYEQLILNIVNNSELRAITQAGKQGRVQSHKRIKNLIDNNPDFVPEQLLNILGQVTQERIKRYAKLPHPEEAFSLKVDPKQQSVTVEIPTDEEFEYIDWYGLTRRGLKQSEAQKRVEKGRINIDNLKNTFVKVVSDYICQQKSLDLDRLKIEQIVRHVIDTDPYAPFVGNNEKEITGLLGEIQALCYIACLVGDKFDLSTNLVRWAATQTIGGKKLHADIIIKNAFGIQVKNTTKDLIDSVPYDNSTYDNLTKLCNILVSSGRFTQQEADIIKDIYTTYYFNIPYVHDPVSGELTSSLDDPSKTLNDYEDTWLTIQDYVVAADKLLQFLFDYILYIGTGNIVEKNEAGNVLFILGGNEVLLASEICLDMLEDIENSRLIFEKPEVGTSAFDNIITFANNNNLVRSDANDFYIHNIKRFPRGVLHHIVADNIILRTSFDYTHVLSKYRG